MIRAVVLICSNCSGVISLAPVVHFANRDWHERLLGVAAPFRVKRDYIALAGSILLIATA
jgi:hypothetical protein